MRAAALAFALAIAACAAAPADRPAVPDAARLRGPVVRIEDSMEHDNHGTGVYLGHGYILTAAHVAVAWNDRKVAQFVGRPDRWRLSFVWRDEVQDIALLRASEVPQDVATASLACRPLRADEPVTMIGYPLDLPMVKVTGTILSPVPIGEDHAVVMDIPTAPGNSGSPLYDADGRVVGVLSKLEIGTLGGLPAIYPYAYMSPVAPVCAQIARAMT
ncbi:MAG: serine protease [Sinobacteraceae bacterium]|nr:serine protease [Nevskiaceae bacterium]